MQTHRSVRDDARLIHSCEPVSMATTGDLASRAADQAANLYADQEHEMRRRRFERAIALAAEDV